MVDSSPRNDNSNSTAAMDKLQAIDQQRAAVERRLVERLQRQLQQLRALLCAAKWHLTTMRRRRPEAYTEEFVGDATKKLRMEVGAFEYAAKEQSELLTRALFQLDDILSNGDEAVKSARKALVLSVQQLLERADTMKAKAASLKQFAERLLERLPTAPEAQDEDEDMEETAAPQSDAAVAQDDDNDWEHVEAEDMRPLFATDDEAEEAEPMEQEPTGESPTEEDAVMVQPEETADNDDADNDDVDDDEADAQADQHDEDEDEPEEGDSESESDSEDEEEEEQEETPKHEEQQREVTEQTLPVWRPYYQIQKRDDGVYIVANLRGVDPRYVQVHAMPQQGVLRISGVKYPTQKDLLLSRLSGAPTFGRFEIVERFPTQMINLENASQQLREDGTLQVRLPFYLVQHPRIMRRVSPFQPHRLVVW